ncbi:MAG: 50S ribosomal protein L9 [Bdellovibrio sp. CG12_big_fil_rev_8_21_14_0_65_39_13]|nr:MAG: 50S ribosomal protein L9 [Bdellovibrio sp. CG22_combo_CG10-13_8_21_14_all_39_27]PIQ59681.1 MAG: 50S ribosomal protein L9 [Bdellovibrio sp. CG12_big_fil_rev_8_21_14_0_65_39_13]PIR36288.1 MAG: 50S ribosomal protein L9 [Bdellovibrio sp. CG11_big_fil_rev_8_21_14_0_20_39_38]PJB54197.1 MAG: 50S ribosomal protein L9 [Bdellovibrio sp. CG_4_9_14_3_um_filter_39_7]
MKVILTEKVPALGNIGDLVNVSQGYARNFLLPKRVAVIADDSHKKQLENQKKALSKKMAAEKDAAEAIKAKLAGLELNLIRRVGANNKLFGTVTMTELAKELAGKGIEVEKRHLTPDQPIKNLGAYNVKAKIFSGVETTFKVKVAIDPVQAEELKKKQAELEAFAKQKKEEQAKADALAAEKAAQGETVQTEEEKLRAEADKLLRG